MDRRVGRSPISTYRLQLHGGFPFAAARAIVPYLSRLGISDCYLSPIFAARPGSTHGYDVTDHNRISDALGGAEEYDRLADDLDRAGMGQVLDIVPNHMAVDATSNPWWRDLLENGLCSIGARFFDIEWAPVKPELTGRVLLPILGDQYGYVLERGELTVTYADGRLELRYDTHRLPIEPGQVPSLLRHNIDALSAEMGEEDPSLRELLSILSALGKMPPVDAVGSEAIAERRREKEVARERLERLVAGSPAIRRHIDLALAAVNGEPGRPASFDALHAVLEAQPYRLAYWRTAAHEINYRRFFDVNDLVSLRVEDPEVFEVTHALLLERLQRGHVTGVRVDHPDGLFDPEGYFERLQALAARAWQVERGDGATRPLYVVAEKILSPGESLPASWAVEGTTGYGFLNEVGGLFVDGAGMRRMRRAYTRFTRLHASFEDVVYDSKKLIMDTSLASELNLLAHAVDRIGERNRKARDFTLNSIRDALVETVACFPIYRTYISFTGWSRDDRAAVDKAIRRARRRNPALEASVFEFLREVVLPRGVDEPLTTEAELYPTDRRSGYPAASEEERNERLHVAMKLQQYTSPVQAKGVEDTAFYRYNVLLSMNEVGGDPSASGVSPAEFHEANRRRRERSARELTATSTHDTKLGEDVRARLSVLAELSEEWSREVGRWRRINQAHRSIVDGEPAPDRNDEYRFYQALVGVCPFNPSTAGMPSRMISDDLVDRLRAYMNKSIKEAKVHTSWINENRAYDEAVSAFVERSLGGGARFVSAGFPFIERVARAGVVNSLAQLVLKLTAPGVPDFYQGTEVWDLNLVDPDNRRPVDFDHRSRLLDAIEPLTEPSTHGDSDRARKVGELLDSWADARIKMFTTTCGLRLRRSDPDLFLRGEYVPLDTEVTVSGGIVAFARTLDGRALITVAPRLAASLASGDRPFPVGESWKTSRVLLPQPLADRAYRNLFTGEEIRPTRTAAESWFFAGEALRVLPVGILVG
jgi:(1->4)-alpha-D-glucan 1-alpha-D-glucosylmutase